MYATLHHQGQARRLHNTLWRDAISELGAQGAIFDCDGTLVHSAEAHYQCMNDAAREQGVEMARAWYVARGGLDRRSLFEAFGRERAPDLNVAQAIETSIARFSEHVSLVRPIEATRDLFQALAGAGIKTAVATNAERSVADLSLRKAGMRAQVGWLVSISDGLPPKPAPHLFEHAAQLMGVPPADVIVIEDSPEGLRAALSAGMRAIVLEPGQSASSPRKTIPLT